GARQLHSAGQQLVTAPPARPAPLLCPCSRPPSPPAPRLRADSSRVALKSVCAGKNRVESERDSAKRWAEKWGFLKTPLEELIGDEKKGDAKPKLQLPDHLRVRPVTPVEKYIKVLPSPPVPKTTQGFIGWRSGVPELALEHDYQIQSCKGTVRSMK
uniref:Uncharacterized protein n=1 Tax=Cyanistes caeruleus TaxID=156563 RepID=A0A8C0VHG1_CYACU